MGLFDRLFGMKTTGQTTQEPWGPAQGQLQDILGEAQTQYQSGTGTQLPGFSPVAGLGQTTQDAIGRISGADFNPQSNPYFKELLDMGSENIANRVNALTSARGRYGSDYHVGAIGDAISQFQIPLLAGAYDSYQNNQMGLFDRLLGAGQIEDQNLQNQRTADYERALWESGGADQAALQRYLSTVGGVAGLGGTAQTQEPRTPIRDLFGGLLAGAGAVGSFF